MTAPEIKPISEPRRDTATKGRITRRAFLAMLGAYGAAPLLAKLPTPSTSTIGALRRAIVDSPVSVGLHRAEAFTTVYQRHADEPWIVRKALSLAIDRGRMIETLLLGYGTPAIGPIPPALWNHHRQLAADPFDPAEARRLLAVAGWRDTDGDGVLDRNGVPFRFEILTKQGDPVRESGSVILRENLRDVGVEVTILAMELAAGLGRLRAGQFDTYYGRLNANLHGDPSGYVKSTAVGEFNSGRYANAEVDSLLAVALGTQDREAALPVWLEIQETLAGDPPAAYLFYPENLVGIGQRLRNVRPHLLSPINNLSAWWIAPPDRKYKTNSG